MPTTDVADTKSITDAITRGNNTPPIAVFVDSPKLDRTKGTPIPVTLVRFAESVGVIERCVLYTQETGNSGKWEQNGFEVAVTKKNSKVHIPLITEAMRVALLRPYVKTMIIVAKDCSVYEELFDELAAVGVTVIVANLYLKAKRPDDLTGRVVYTTLKELQNVEHSTPTVVAQDLTDYDFSEFIQLMATSEDKMPFIGVRFFINKVMWRLGDTDQQICQNVFHQAEELGIVELYKSTNINEGAPDVSACRLNRDNQVVRGVLGQPLVGSPEEAGIIDISLEPDSVTVLVDTNMAESVPTDTDQSSPEDSFNA